MMVAINPEVICKSIPRWTDMSEIQYKTDENKENAKEYILEYVIGSNGLLRTYCLRIQEKNPRIKLIANAFQALSSKTSIALVVIFI